MSHKPNAGKSLPIVAPAALGVAIGLGLIISALGLFFLLLIPILWAEKEGVSVVDEYALPKFHEVMGQSGSPKDRVASPQTRPQPKPVSPNKRRK